MGHPPEAFVAQANRRVALTQARNRVARGFSPCLTKQIQPMQKTHV